MSGKLSDLYKRRWVCCLSPARLSGRQCSAIYPHANLDCGHRWQAPDLTDEQAAQVGLTYQSACETNWHVHTADAPDGSSPYCQFGESFESANPHQ